MKYSYGKIQKLGDSLMRHGVDEGTFLKVMQNGERVKQTDKNADKSKWFIQSMKVMDAEIESGLRHQIREDCACCLTGKRHSICKKINKDYSSTSERIRAANEAKYVFGNGVKEIGKGKYEVWFFDEANQNKTCPCLKDLDEKMPIIYCYCCGGHVKHHLQTVLGVPLRVKVVSSVLSSQGKRNCRFELSEV